MRTDHMIFTAFMSASTTKTSLGAWTHKSTDRGILTAEYYITLAKMLERGGFDLLFFDDRLAMPAAYRGSIEPAVQRGSRAVKLDILTILGAISTHTSRIGLGGTYSTTYGMPYHVARAFSTLDHLSGGRAVWNIVTSLNEDEAANFGADYLNPAERYDRAEEFLDIVTRLWESWGKDALKFDRESGIFADPEQVHEIDYTGKFLSSRGPLTVPQSPQGWPTLLQAGQSDRGRDFAAKWADLVFTSTHDSATAITQYKDQKERLVAAGRPASSMKIMPAILTIVGETEEIAREKEAYFDSLFEPEEQLVFLSEQANFDFSKLPMDEPLTDDLLESVSGTRGSVEGYIRGARKKFGEDATLRQLIAARSKQGDARFVGTPEQVADKLEEWFLNEACDGFAIMPADVPGTWEDFVRLVMPELRRRGRVPEDISDGGNFRKRLGLEDRVQSLVH